MKNLSKAFLILNSMIAMTWAHEGHNHLTFNGSIGLLALALIGYIGYREMQKEK